MRDRQAAPVQVAAARSGELESGCEADWQILNQTVRGTWVLPSGSYNPPATTRSRRPTNMQEPLPPPRPKQRPDQRGARRQHGLASAVPERLQSLIRDESRLELCLLMIPHARLWHGRGRCRQTQKAKEFRRNSLIIPHKLFELNLEIVNTVSSQVSNPAFFFFSECLECIRNFSIVVRYSVSGDPVFLIGMEQSRFTCNIVAYSLRNLIAPPQQNEPIVSR
jgi:hypothetical protein